MKGCKTAERKGFQADMLNRFDEKSLYKTDLIGSRCKSAEEDIRNLIDIIFGDKTAENKIDYDFFDVKGTVLLHGIAGVGKTTIARNCMYYALDKYGVESYSIDVPDIIVSGLGESVKNLSDALSEFDDLKEGILFLDEIDKLFVNRESESELSELKRLLIQFMGYVDNLSVSKNKLMIGCTNVYDQIDAALKRRFSINEEITVPVNEDKNAFFKICLHRLGMDPDDMKLNKGYLERFETMDSIKAFFRRHILDHSIDELVGELNDNQ